MKQLLKACENLDAQLAGMDPATRIWLDHFVGEKRTMDEKKLRSLDRIYDNYHQMAHAEAARTDGVEVVTVVGRCDV